MGVLAKVCCIGYWLRYCVGVLAKVCCTGYWSRYCRSLRCYGYFVGHCMVDGIAPSGRPKTAAPRTRLLATAAGSSRVRTTLSAAGGHVPACVVRCRWDIHDSMNPVEEDGKGDQAVLARIGDKKKKDKASDAADAEMDWTPYPSPPAPSESLPIHDPGFCDGPGPTG